LSRSSLNIIILPSTLVIIVYRQHLSSSSTVNISHHLPSTLNVIVYRHCLSSSSTNNVFRHRSSLPSTVFKIIYRRPSSRSSPVVRCQDCFRRPSLNFVNLPQDVCPVSNGFFTFRKQSTLAVFTS